MNKLILGTSLLLFFTACSKESTGSGSSEIPNIDDEGVEVSFNSGVTTSVTTTSVTTRSGVLNMAIPKGDHVGIYGIPAIKENPDEYTIDKFMNQDEYQENLFNANYEVISTSGTKSTLKQQFTAKFPSNKSGKNALAFYAYYPFIENSEIENVGKGPQAIPIQLNNKDMSKTLDYLYTGQIISGITTNAVELNFKHALGRLDFRIYSDNAYNIGLDPVSIKSVTVTALHTPTGKMFLEDGEITPDNTVLTPYIYPLTKETIQYSKTENVSKLNPVCSFLLVPGDIISIKCLLETKQNGEKEYEIYNLKDYPDQADRITLTKGQTVNANVLYTPRDVEVSGKLSGWTNAETRTFNINVNQLPTN